MPTLLSLDDHLAALVRSGAALGEAAAAAGLEAKVPTCPAWDVTDLLVHQGMVHRWAAANLRGERDHDTAASQAEGVDAIAARSQRWPTAAEVAIDPVLAADGIDELLIGLITRGKGRLHTAEPYTVLIRTDDTGHAWTLRISDGPIVAAPGAIERPEVVFSGTAVQLYLSLWNRADEITTNGRSDLIDQWRKQIRIRWS